MATLQRPRCFLDISVGAEPAGRLTFELFVDKTPKTCENFRSLCTGEHDGLSYAKAPLHRVIDEFMIQGGDIAAGDGTGTASIYGGEFEDENLSWREMDAAGLLCSANRGKDTNGSQFFITLEPCPHLNGKHTIFGRIVSGQEVLDKIAKVDVDKADRPLEPVLIARCGELEKRKKPTQPAERSTTAKVEQSAERGRRRRSDTSDDEMRDNPEPAKTRKPRRKSDNVVDEGLRGRPRQRSRSRSVSRPLSTPSEERSDDHNSPVEKHKRKRSPSPSRHVDRRHLDSQNERRRRRSLPNQYKDDDDRYKPSPRRDSYLPAGNRRDDGRRDRRDDNRGDRYRPRDRYGDDSRLDGAGDGRLGGGGYDDYDPPVKFKGRGVMKYKEPGRL